MCASSIASGWPDALTTAVLIVIAMGTPSRRDATDVALNETVAARQRRILSRALNNGLCMIVRDVMATATQSEPATEPCRWPTMESLDENLHEVPRAASTARHAPRMASLRRR